MKFYAIKNEEYVHTICRKNFKICKINMKICKIKSDWIKSDFDVIFWKAVIYISINIWFFMKLTAFQFFFEGFSKVLNFFQRYLNFSLKTQLINVNLSVLISQYFDLLTENHEFETLKFLIKNDKQQMHKN